MRGLLAVAAVAVWVYGGIVHAQQEHRPAKVINVVVMGGTGNLAQKYLWQGLFNIMATPASPFAPKLAFWPAATKSREISQPLMDAILRDNVSYSEFPPNRTDFLARVGTYHKLAAKEDYVELQNAMEQREKWETEIGRVVYLSVPPKFFGGIAAEINAHLRPFHKGAWLKVIVEKPFGVDLASAKQLSNDLFVSLKADEVLLVDHYMGKYGLHAIRDFHAANKPYRALFTKDKVESIMVSMVETEDVKGRTSFYDEVGVVRDTMQNHLMMMISLLAMQPGGKETEERLKVAKAIVGPVAADIMQVAQYTSYQNHVASDRAAARQPPLSQPSRTPTYARIVLRLAEPHPLAGVPFVLSSGKAMKRRRAFAVVNFKDGTDLTFNVQGEYMSSDGTVVKEAAVYASSGLPEIKMPLLSPLKKNANGNPRLYSAPPKSPSAYQVLLRDVLEGRFESFVNIPEVLESWRYWDAMLKLVDQAELELYDHGGKGLGIKVKKGETWPDVDNGDLEKEEL